MLFRSRNRWPPGVAADEERRLRRPRSRVVDAQVAGVRKNVAQETVVEVKIVIARGQQIEIAQGDLRGVAIVIERDEDESVQRADLRVADPLHAELEFETRVGGVDRQAPIGQPLRRETIVRRDVVCYP